ncbi:amino acid adenylation domain-containing protein [Gordonia sp. (in: high G+C Gram-positive bacteria)]|uniref:amino acid adenylation domain-containing protein n=1 Tax=Gordonia sp. (in: high G+C Gram-positive bacteria) TaxID=84139 RepID=UPI003C71FD37
MTVDLAGRRRELLRKRLEASGLAHQSDDASANDDPPRAHRDRTNLPLAARRLWFVGHRDAADTSLNVSVAFGLHGVLDETRFRTAFRSVVAQHEPLRARYLADDAGEPVMEHRIGDEIAWTQIDLSDLSDTAAQRRVQVLAAREARTPFRLAEEAPLRVTLATLASDRYVLLLTVHHIAWDDDSWAVLFRDLARAYRGEAVDVPRRAYADIPDPSEQQMAADLAYWHSTLRPAPEMLDLPPARLEAGSGRVHLPLDASLEAAVTDLARSLNTTPFAVFIAATRAFLHRAYGGGVMSDAALAVPTTVRPAGADDLIGYFGNTILLRGPISASSTFTELVGAASDSLAAALNACRTPIDLVVAEVSDDRRAGLAGLVSTSLSLRHDLAGLDLEGVAIAHLDEFHAPKAQLPLEFAVVLGVRPVLELQYQASRFGDAHAHAILSAYSTFLANAVARPDAPIRDARLLDAATRDAVLSTATGPAMDDVPDTLVGMFEAVAAVRPDHPAIVTDDRTLTYAELDAAADHLSCHLAEAIAEADGTSDPVVALRMAASADFVVAALAVGKAGAAYVPVDPDYPADRVKFLLEDARPAVTLDAADVARLRAAPTDGFAIPGRARPSSLAYLIYTSGSTGTPKGVAVEHRAIAEHLRAFDGARIVGPDDRLLQTSSVSFDASIFEIFATLTAGATLVIGKRGALTDIPYLAELLVREQVTVMHMVPSMLSTLLLIPEVKQWTTLRTVPVGGEALPGEVADAFTTAFTANLSNNYGPTEGVVAATHHRIDGPRGGAVVPIGRPNPGVTAHLLDAGLQPVPVGMVGELYLGGRQLARGYLRRSGLTASRFIANPFGREDCGAGERLYRTGDLARRDEVGELHFVGRSDDQLKVRGFRIEPGEIEAILAADDVVQRALVTVVDDRLLAYVIAADGAVCSPESLRDLVAKSVPSHMVPDAVVVIDDVPITVHGKLDRDALPIPDLTHAVFVEPETRTQRRVAAVFSELFADRAVGAHDSFFDLGGHSLLAARLVTALSSEFGLDVDVRDPFENPTVSGLAALLVERARAELGVDLDADGAQDDWANDDWANDDWASTDWASEPTAARPPLVVGEPSVRSQLSFSQLAMWFNHRFSGGSAADNIVLTLAIDGPVDHDALQSALDDVVARHASLRTSFAEVDGLPTAVVADQVEVPLDVDGTDESATAAFDLASAPLLRATLIDGVRLVLAIHHMVVDHASTQLILGDLADAYRFRLRGQVPPPPPSGAEYSDVVAWQHRVFGLEADGEAARFGRKQVDFWRERLDGLPDEILVAADRPRPDGLSQRGHLVDFTVPAACYRTLKTVFAASGVSDFMAVNGLWAATLASLGAGPDIAVGTPAAGRTPETEGIVGLLANMVVLRNDLSGTPTLSEVLHRSRDAVLDGFAHQDVPIERLVEALNPRRTRARNPLFQTMIHFRDGAGDAPIPLVDGTRMRLLPMEMDTSYLDLNLIVSTTDSGSLTGRLVVSADLYDEDTAHGIAERFVSLCTALADDPQRPLADIAGPSLAATLDRSVHAENPAALAELIAAGSPRRVQARPSTLAGLPHAGLTHCASVATWIVDGPGAAVALPETLRALSPGSVVIDNYATAPASTPAAEVYTAGGGTQTATERALVAMLEELLSVKGIGRDDNFFAVGGDSVISIQWSARAAASGIALDPQQIFDYYSIAELAEAIDAAQTAAVVEEPEPMVEAAPMSASGLSADMLSALGSAWGTQK